MLISKQFVVGLFCAFIVLSIPLGQTDFVSLPLALTLVFGLTFLMLGLGRFDRRPPLLEYTALYAVGTLWLFFTTLISGDWSNSDTIFPVMLGILVMLLAITGVKRFPSTGIWLVIGLFALGVFVAGVVWSYFGWGYVTGAEDGGVLRGSAHFEAWPIGGRNWVGRIFFGAGVACLLGVVFCAGRWRTISKILFFIFFALTLLSFSARSIFAFFLLVVAYFFSQTGGSKARALSASTLLKAITAVSAAYFLMLFVFPGQIDMVLQRAMGLLGFGGPMAFEADGVSGRRLLIAEISAIIVENPLVGIGLENSRKTMRTFSHVDLLELAASGGILAPIPFYLGYIIILKAIWNLDQHASKIRTALLLAGIAVISFGISGDLYRNALTHVSLVALYLIPLHYRVSSIGTNSKASAHRFETESNRD